MRSVQGGWVAVAACDGGGCSERMERAADTEAEAAVSLTYAAHDAGWNSDNFPPGLYCPACKARTADAFAADRLAAVRRGYVQMRRLYAELGLTTADEDAMGTPRRAFAGLAGILMGSGRRRRGQARADNEAVAGAFADLALLADGLTWAEVRA
jgi:hypothetical protein